MCPCSWQQSNISVSRENDVCHVSTLFSSVFVKWFTYTHTYTYTYTHSHVHTLDCFFFSLPYPTDLSHIVSKKSTLTQQPIIFFQETQNEAGEETKTARPDVQCSSSQRTNPWQTASSEFMRVNERRFWNNSHICTMKIRVWFPLPLC